MQVEISILVICPEMDVTEVVKKFRLSVAGSLLAVSAVPRWSRQFAPEHQHGPCSIDQCFSSDDCQKCSAGRGAHSPERRHRIGSIQSESLQKMLSQSPPEPETPTDETITRLAVDKRNQTQDVMMM